MRWRDRSLLGLLTAELVSLTGSAMTFVALPWFVLATTGATAKMGWVLAAEVAAVALLGLPSGTLIARIGAKRTMLICDAARGPLMVVIPVLYWTDHLSFPALLAVSFAVGCFSGPYFASTRVVIPEVAGDDERHVAEVNAVLGGANQLTQIAGPVLAGLLIAATSPAAVLVVDAGTYLFSFLTILLVVRAGRRVEQTEESRGVLAGVRFLVRDPLLGPTLAVAVLLNLVVQGLIIGIDVLGFYRYGSAHVLGFLFGAFGLGALLGAVAAQQLSRRVDLLLLPASAVVLMPLPLWFLPLSLPWAGATAVLAAFAFFTPLVNAPLLGVLSVRTPPALRPKVMAAVVTAATLAGPLGLFGAAQALRVVSIETLFVAVAALLTALSVAFAAVLLRNRGDASRAPEPAAA
jgi:MFS family permease